MKAILFYALIVVAFYASPYTNLFFLAVCFLSVLGMLGAWWTDRNLRGMTAGAIAIEPAPAHAEHDVRFRLDPAGRTRFQVSLSLKISGEWHRVDRAGTVTEPATRSGRLAGLPRGLHRVEAASLESPFPFGLFRARRPVELPSEVIVYPAPLDQNHTPESFLSELMGLQDCPAGEGSPTGLREYRPGDPMRLIHWKASARKMDFVVKEMDGDAQDSVEVVFDRRCNPEAFERSLSTLSALALLTSQNDMPLTIHSQGLCSTYGTVHRPLRDCLVWLAKAQRLETGSAPPPPTSPSVLRLPTQRGIQEVSHA